jgi:chaperonin GroES
MAAVDKLLDLLNTDNVASKIPTEKLNKIATEAIRGYRIDRESRRQWEDRCEEAIKFAKQISEPKSFPWEGSSNIIFPLLTTASNAFAARTYPEIVKGKRIVKAVGIGDDPEGQKEDQADRVSEHMSYQRLIQSDTWEPDTDKLLHMLPIIGVCFRKVYYDPIDDLPQADLCSPQDIVVNHTTPSLDKAYRVTHRYKLNKNQILEKIRNKYFIDFDIDDSLQTIDNEDIWDTSLDDNTGNSQDGDTNVQLEFLEQHTFLDLDGDGYEEPWIIIVNKSSNETVGIYPRFDPDKIKTDPKGQILRIVPIQYFVDYHFLPSPDGGFYSLGYGHVLYPLNEAINTLMNQLVDAGTLSNTQCGLVSRSLKIKGGNLNLQMGEFVPVDPGTTGRVSDSIYQFQFPGASPVLMQLLSLVIQSAKEIASINDILTGDAKPQNAPATSVMEMSNQGMKLFSSIAKRLYRSLKKEFQLLFKLNADFLDDEVYFNYHDSQTAVARQDYNMDNMEIVPIADPNMGSDIQRSMQAQAMTQFMQNQVVLGELKLNNIVREFFEALRIPEDKINQFVLTPEEKAQQAETQGPNLDQQKLQLEIQKMQKDFEVKMAQNEKANRELELKYLDLTKKYQIKDAETEEKQLRMKAQAFKMQKDVDTADRKLDIEEQKVEAMKEKIRHE